jgi:drug/metabolite transporter (DMT)-like permease
VLSPLARLTTITAAGVVVLIAGAAIEWAVQDHPQVTGKGVVLGMIAGVFPGFGAYLAHAFVRRELGTARTSLILYLAPLWGALFAWIWLGEALHGYHVLGAALILPGIALANHGAGARTTIGTQPMARSAWPILRRS